jgi:CheY-like chemotaxis protein
VRFYKGNYFGKTVVLVLAIDITDRYNMISEIIANKEKAEESDRLKTAFLHNISHEIRTPMNGIVGFSALITQPGLPSKEVEEYFGIINDCSNQLLAIINDIVSIATLEAGQEKLRESNMNLNKAIQLAVLQHHGKAIEKGLNLYYTFGLVDDSAEIIADETKLTQVLNNLISNGIKFTSSGSVHVGYSVENKSIKLFIKDTGLGIAPEMHDVIFDRFRQVNHALSMNTGGTGLGLSISKSYIELMGGRIWLESEPGIGSTFYIELPFKQSLRRFTGNDHKREEINGEFLNGKTIVVAEDEEYNFRLIKGMLSGYGPNLVHLINGQQAVDYCKANQAVDVILMDLKMAVMDGFDASEIIRKIKPGLPIIAQSALALIGDREKALNAGCSDYIAKPLRKEQLLILLKKHLG